YHGVVVLGVSASGQLVARADLRLGEPEDLQPGPQQGKANVVELDRVQQLELAVCGAARSRQRDEALPSTLQQETTIGRDRVNRVGAQRGPWVLQDQALGHETAQPPVERPAVAL